MTVRYAHIRYFTENGEDLVTKGGITYAYEFLPDGKLRAAKAVCSHRDNYCRRIGRDVSLGRLLNGKAVTFDFPDDSNVVDFLLDNL